MIHNKVIELVKGNWRSIIFMLFTRYLGWLPDEYYLRGVFRIMMGYRLNLKNPKTFNEKIQWLKLNDRNSLYTSLVDKYEVKSQIANLIGEDYIIPTLGVWDRPEDIDWDSLPDQFVLKTTHGGGNLGVIICKSKQEINKQEICDRLRNSLQQDIYKLFCEWPYKNVKRRIIAEKLMMQEDGTALADYKFFCFNGKPEYIYLRHEEKNESKPRLSFITMDWQFAPFYNPGYSQFESIPPKPVLFEEMKCIAEKLSKGHSFLRVDLYIINNHVYFSELTFYPSSGMRPFEPVEWDKKLGDLIKL